MVDPTGPIQLGDHRVESAEPLADPLPEGVQRRRVAKIGSVGGRGERGGGVGGRDLDPLAGAEPE